MEQQGFDNLAYWYGSQSELHPSPKPASKTFRLLGLIADHRAVEITLSHLNGVLAVIWSIPEGLLQVEYDDTVTTAAELALQLQTLGCSVEAVALVKVDGMHCQSCVQSIEGRIGNLSGVSHIQLSLQHGVAVIVHQPLFITHQELKDQIQDMGFDADLVPEDAFGGDLSLWQGDLMNEPTQTVTVWIKGMTCSSCVQSIEGRISEVAGVKSITVSLKETKGAISFNPKLIEPEHFRALIDEMGFSASLEGKRH